MFLLTHRMGDASLGWGESSLLVSLSYLDSYCEGLCVSHSCHHTPKELQESVLKLSGFMTKSLEADSLFECSLAKRKRGVLGRGVSKLFQWCNYY